MLVIVGLLLAPPQVSASKGGVHTEADAGTRHTVDDAYVFVTPRAGNLSTTVRRALQLYDQDKTDFSLTPAMAMFAETNVVQRMGSRWLEPGEKVVVSRQLLQDYAARSRELNAAQLAAWQQYAERATFDIAHIQPETTAAPQQSQAPQPQTQKEPSLDAKVEAQPVQQSGNAKGGPIRSVYWAAAVLALAGMYYLMGRRLGR